MVEARIRLLEGTLAHSAVRAPFAGNVAHRHLDAGSRVVPGTPVVRLIRSQDLRARFAVPADQVDEMTPGTAVRVDIDTFGSSLVGRIEHLAPEFDAASLMVFVEAGLETGLESHRIPLGIGVLVSKASDHSGKCRQM